MHKGEQIVSQQVEPRVHDADSGYSGRFMAVIFNNETNSFEEVVETIAYATCCTMDEAYCETWEAHHYGKAAIHFGSQEVCCAVASIVSNIGVRTEVRPEWDD
jgi:ATP-dependent Clp protease adapter protein ClpS